MEWIERLEKSISYIEENLSGEIDYKKLAQIACCSEYHYQRIFSYMVDVPLSEYIRKRRLSLAGVDLLHGEKVIDVAVKYGYESPNSFARAFKAQHGVTPSQAQSEGSKLKSYSRIKFHITIRGDVEMEYRIETKSELRLIGAKKELSRVMEENFRDVPEFWTKIQEDGRLEKLLPLMDTEVKGVFGISDGFVDETQAPAYYIAVASTEAVPEGFVEFRLNEQTWAVFEGEGAMPLAIQELEKRIMTEWLPSSGYEYANGPDVELYITPDPQSAVFEVWVPVKKS